MLKNGIILHSDQGSQYTSKEFTDFCTTHNITQSMSRAGCPYDNAPMERYFNTLKSELIYQHTYASESKLFSDIDDYVLLWYNSVRPHSFNNGLTPWQKRSACFLGETVTILLDKNTSCNNYHSPCRHKNYLLKCLMYLIHKEGSMQQTTRISFCL